VRYSPNEFSRRDDSTARRMSPKSAAIDLTEATLLIEDWRIGYNTERPHSSLGYLTPLVVSSSIFRSGAPELLPRDPGQSRPAAGEELAVRLA
jgi:Integrase core domain